MKASSAVSETPELIDAGQAKSEGGAKIATKEKLNKHLRALVQEQRKAEAAKAPAEPKPAAAKKPAKPVSENDASRGNPAERKAARQAAAAPKTLSPKAAA